MHIPPRRTEEDMLMEYRRLGRAGLYVSPVALGTMSFGPDTSERDAHTILDTAVAHGINVVDTADVYGADTNRTIAGISPRKGYSEEIIGRWFKADLANRDRVVLATKVYGTMGEGPNDKNLSAAHIRRACDESLRRLQTDHIDLYMLHHVDRTTSWDEIWDALSVLRQQGKIVYVGTSNHAAWHIVQGQCAAEKRGLLGIVAEESLYNLMQRTVELEVLPACQALGIGVLVYSPLNSGLLSGILGTMTAGARTSSGRAVAGLAQDRDRISDYEDFCQKYGEHPATIGLAWLLHRPGVTSTVIGARTLEHLQTGLRAVDVTLDEDALDQLDRLFPGPQGPAPEAYAW